jgi:hypothetical protein
MLLKIVLCKIYYYKELAIFRNETIFTLFETSITCRQYWLPVVIGAKCNFKCLLMFLYLSFLAMLQKEYYERVLQGILVGVLDIFFSGPCPKLNKYSQLFCF